MLRWAKKVREKPQSQTAALPRHQEEEETDKSKQAQMEQTYENQALCPQPLYYFVFQPSKHTDSNVDITSLQRHVIYTKYDI